MQITSKKHIAVCRRQTHDEQSAMNTFLSRNVHPIPVDLVLHECVLVRVQIVVVLYVPLHDERLCCIS